VDVVEVAILSMIQPPNVHRHTVVRLEEIPVQEEDIRESIRSPTLWITRMMPVCLNSPPDKAHEWEINLLSIGQEVKIFKNKQRKTKTGLISRLFLRDLQISTANDSE
jgi:hypothetical protein